MSNQDEENYMDDELLLNARKPKGELGEKLIENMNINHESLAQWSLNHLEIDKDDFILDIGCGGGVNVERFLKMTDNKVFGLDYSELSVEKSIELNRESIDDGRCEIIQGSVSDMPFEEGIFNIATAFETVYFWPDFVNDLKEVHRILKKDGIFFIANEALPNEYDKRQQRIIELLEMHIYSKEELEDSLEKAGFSDVKCFIKEAKDSFTGDDAYWICVIAKK
ncbi:SAM-dependent methyltransferase UbiE family [Methanobrevibacter ruminantium M1]|uniref:SAM-dependent methyltransferase UbiE family n=1 Tax=Methanobrevibacter ruminantium (strain ATCC 35063 / DSM 1093 / JCM 13430 / OCM 146 / M1) TaxID=634498 RepID=D3E2I7_METRM|nr:class I SAM-dependent methyltransferase [Methanobrevibacter ruminantium]ADC46748.1 SAM-dependent methyltransferase UbiE family [Methanobrevibacter ruminantium M1]